jgi:hypothetical protein
LHIFRHFARAFCFAATISLCAACGPQGPHGGGHGGHGGHMFGMGRHAFGMGARALRLGMRGTRPPGFRRACAGDAQRLCPTATTRRDQRTCLEGKQDSLSADCKTALTHPHQ